MERGKERTRYADEDQAARLLERCEPGTPLRALPEYEQDVMIARLLLRLWRVPPAQHLFRPLSALLRHWSRETLAQMEQWPEQGPDKALVQEGLRLFSELPTTAPTEALLATDLHPGNVLRAEREPWLGLRPPAFCWRSRLRRNPVPVQLQDAATLGRRWNNSELCGPAWGRSRTRSAVDFCPSSRRTARRLAQSRLHDSCACRRSVSLPFSSIQAIC